MLVANRSISVASALLCALLAASASPAKGTPPIPTPSVNAACAVPTGIDDAPDAFKAPLDDTRTLAFIAIEERLPPKLQADVARKASAVPSATIANPIDAALSDPCAIAQVVTRYSRLLYALSLRWPDASAGDFEQAARYAISALYLGDKIASTTRDAALAPFDTSVQELDAFIATAEHGTTPGASQTCENVQAKTTNAIAPSYPIEAKIARETGIVLIKVMLDTHGFVRAAELFSSSVKEQDDHGLIPAAILAAGSSDYAPGQIGCRQVAGAYLFRVDFAASRK